VRETSHKKRLPEKSEAAERMFKRPWCRCRRVAALSKGVRIWGDYSSKSSPRFNLRTRSGEGGSLRKTARQGTVKKQSKLFGKTGTLNKKKLP